MAEITLEYPRVNLYCRADAAFPARRHQRTVRERLGTLVESGVVAGVEVETWPTAVPLDGDDTLDPHADAREAYETFEAWAEEADASLSPFFECREHYTLEDPSSSTRECLLPVVALIVHEDGEVVAAYPHVVDGEPRDVDDALETLESSGIGPSVEAERDPWGLPTNRRSTVDRPSVRPIRTVISGSQHSAGVGDRP